MADIHYMTADGLEKLKKDLADALAQRPVISAAIAEAREKGDLSENAEYDAAREAQGLLEVKITNLKNQVANAKVIDESQIGTDKVSMMNKVKVENLSMKRVMEFTIVGETEADFSKGRLAVTTPIAKALLGHSKGEIPRTSAPRAMISMHSSISVRSHRAIPLSFPRTWRTTISSTWTAKPTRTSGLLPARWPRP